MLAILLFWNPSAVRAPAEQLVRGLEKGRKENEERIAVQPIDCSLNIISHHSIS